MSTSQKICLVTGASRGIGKGIALALCKAGHKVYITGRTKVATKKSPVAMDTTAAEINKVSISSGGQCIPIICDHADDESTKNVFETIVKENNGRLDILVNNAYAAVNALLESNNQKFWEKDLSIWNASHNVGLRSHYVCSVYASKIMVPKQQGLIVNISSFGGLEYAWFANDIAYGVGKAALDRLGNDMAHELKKHNVCCVTLWPGTVRTELVGNNPGFENGETPEFSGRCVLAISENLNKIFPSRTGRILLSTELAEEFDFTDIDGKIPNSHPNDLREQMTTPPKHWVLSGGNKYISSKM